MPFGLDFFYSENEEKVGQKKGIRRPSHMLLRLLLKENNSHGHVEFFSEFLRTKEINSRGIFKI